MDSNNIKKIKELFNLTKVSISLCNEALKKNNGDIKKSIEWIKEQGAIKISNSNNNNINEGIIKSLCDDKSAVIFEIGCQTDFAAKNNFFINSANDFAKTCLQDGKITNFEQAKKIFNSIFSMTIVAIKETLVLKRFEKIYKKENECFGYYNHMNKISTIVILEKEDKDLAEKIAVHISSKEVKYIKFDDVDKDFLKKEKEKNYEIIKNDKKLSSKPKELIEKIVNMKTEKEIKEVVLYEQPFLYDETKKVSDFLKDNKVIKFVKYAIKK